MTKYCLSCRSKIPADALECPACGKVIALPPPPPGLDNSGLKSAGIALGIALLVILAGGVLYSRQNQKADAAPSSGTMIVEEPANALQPASKGGLGTPDVILKEQKMRDDVRGATYTFYCSRVNSIHCRAHYDGAAQFAFDGVIYDGDKYDLDKVLKYQPIRTNGVTACAFYTSKGVYLATSTDDGNNFELPSLLTNEMTLFKAYLSTLGSGSVRVEGRALVADAFRGISVGDKVFSKCIYSEKDKKWEEVDKGHAIFTDE